jgi:hypothetical protein
MPAHRRPGEGLLQGVLGLGAVPTKEHQLPEQPLIGAA